ncbi:MAG: NusG domain II-containing protein [Spirochaetales bacterium]|nr:NusG domain II-containing protein [Spirochaetales bacterium]
MKFHRIIKPVDSLIFLINVAVILLLSISVYGGRGEPSNVLIEAGGERWIFSLDEDRVEFIQGNHGETVIEIKGGKVHIADSPCPDKLCVQMGWLEKPNDWAACLPNGVFLTIEGDSDGEIDAISQ